MDRRQFLKEIGFSATVLSLAGCGAIEAKVQAAGKKPNIVFIMADDLGCRELGCYGQRKIKTPNIDQMAAEGMRFTDFYTGTPVCAPARCNLVTGMHGGHAFIRDNAEVGTWESFDGQLPLPAGIETFATMLKRRGYATGAFGKWGLGAVGSTGDPLNQGFDRFVGYNCQRHAHNLYPEFLVSDKDKMPLEGNTGGLTGRQYAPQVIADHMLDFVRENKDKPFFVYFPTVLPHLALQAPQEEIDAYKGQWPETPYEGESYQPHPTPRACYAAMISIMDKHVGQLMALLEELALDDNTIVFFTSDNGTTYLKNQVDYEFFNSVGNFRGLKGSVYEGGIRVPLVVRWPGRIKPGAVTAYPAILYDVMATLADITDSKPAAETDGISFLPTLLSKPRRQKKHEYLFWDFAGYGGQLAVRMGKWKGVKRDLQKNPDTPLELYDLEKDISEKNNVADRYPLVAQKIEGIMLSARTKPSTPQFQFGKYPEPADNREL
ncbi:MAG: arylsulfatase [Planctomycetales bacterium]|nr:arylsulfatase [Planctomycetales bacterium]